MGRYLGSPITHRAQRSESTLSGKPTQNSGGNGSTPDKQPQSLHESTHEGLVELDIDGDCYHQWLPVGNSGRDGSGHAAIGVSFMGPSF